ncbi:MAG: DUF4301 family protein [Bacteroidales bacterium]|nr:DUF4301 family protein [Bacteroidales bacterium]
MTIEEQINYFKQGFPWLDVIAPARPDRGIEVMDEAARDAAVVYSEKASVGGRLKFVPASGAASRMFKDIFAGMDRPNDAVRRLTAELGRFAFYDPALFGTPTAGNDEECMRTARLLLTDEGLGYGSKPKGVLEFHRYPQETRTAFAEHLVEGQEYMQNADGSVNLCVTISPEHKDLFLEALEKVRAEYEKRYDVRYNVEFTFQDPATNTIAVDMNDEPFLCDDGSRLFRPAGHGALIYNLNKVEEELVSIKNIDNVAVERLLPVTSLYKKVLMGRALQLRDTIFGYLRRLDEEATPALLDEIQKWLEDTLCIRFDSLPNGLETRAAVLRAKLDRPIRVCGMVRNLGEPGGGPFIVKGSDGSTSLQILESAQINKDNPVAAAALAGATHFNPVDLVCCLRDYKGRRFDLLKHVDSNTGFISYKSYQGRELKALELPGLWNGSMSDWNTLFVEVPVETFNPVKVVLDLLRPAHQN